MAFAPPNINIVGYFTEVEFGKIFAYVDVDPDDFALYVPAHGGKNVRYPHKIFVGPNNETRYAFVKKTVAHVVTDERTIDGNTSFVVEKWKIKQHRKIQRRFRHT